MKIESLAVELRPRSGWEAMELGAALVRRHAAAIWLPWIIVTGLAFVLLNLAAWAIDQLWLALLAMWWLRPVFDRIPLYVLSRSVFGSVPTVADTVRAQLHWGWRPMLGHLTWRRLSPFRTAMLPVDLLEGAAPAVMRERRRVIGAGNGGHAAMLLLMCLHFIVALQFSALLIPMVFVPNELLSETARGAWLTITENPPVWALIALNLVDWLAVALIEPFYIGAGFGLYLNRRTQLEAWDLEIAFRRMRQRLAAATGTALLALVCLAPLAMSPGPASAQETAAAPAEVAPVDAAAAEEEATEDGAVEEDAVDEDTVDEDTTEDEPRDRRLEDIFGDQTVAHEAFGRSVKRAYTDGDLRPKQTITTWKPKTKKDEKKKDPFDMPELRWLGTVFAFFVEYGLWLLFAVLVGVLIATAKHWLPWLQAVARPPLAVPEPVEVRAVDHHEPLPPDIAATARRLWAQGQPRRALALLYRASVEAMAARIDAHLPPGATEAECLRASRRMPEAEDREAFQRVVRVWQYAAYGHSLPEGGDFEALLDVLARRFRWSA
jgi:hypothetical protein